MECYQLQTISSYCYGKSSVKSDVYAKRLNKLGYKGGGIADFGDVFCFPSFAEAMKEEGLKPIFGMIVSLSIKQADYLGELIVLSEAGYKNLISLYNLHKSSYDEADLKEKTDGLAFILKTEGPEYKDFSFLNTHNDAFYSFSKLFKIFLFGIEIYSKEESEEIEITRSFISGHSYDSIAFPKTVYLDKEGGYQTYRILKAINEKTVVTEEELSVSGPYFLLSPKVMEQVYAQEEIAALVKLVNRIDFTFMKKRGQVLKYGAENAQEMLKNDSNEGLKLKLGGTIPEKYQKQLDYELEVIHKMRFDDYFLIVADYVRFAKKAGIKVGPGRGSAAGALVSFGLDITQIDPLHYGLYFERFLNPLRVTLPDIDIDFQDDRRTEVITYLKTKYGPDRVALIITFSTLQLRSAIKSAGTALGIPTNRIESLSKAISGRYETFEEEIKGNYRFQRLVSDPYFHSIVERAKMLLNYPVGSSVHASGVILSEEPLSINLPIIQGETNIVGYENKALDEMGFLKMDILALNYLTFIDKIEKNIVRDGKKIPDIEKNLNDQKAYDVLNDLMLTDIFQLESSGFRNTVRQIRPNNISDISVMLALYRPGPMSNIATYADRKNNHTPYHLPCKMLDDILKDTYGIIIYQEQILQIAKQIAGFEGGKADLFRRAISKKDVQKMNELKKDFINGAISNGLTSAEAENIFELIQKFAEYGYNKSHSIAYAYITYTLLLYKAEFTQEFYEASLSKISLSDPKFARIMNELRYFSFRAVHPSINASQHSMSFQDGKFVVGLDQIKNISARFSDPIIEERKKGRFVSLGDFLRRTTNSQLSQREMISLINSGCLDEFGYTRLGLESQVPNLLMAGSFATDEQSMPILPKSDGIMTVENYLNEFAALGAVLSFRLEYLIKGEKKYQRLYVVSDDPQKMGNQQRLEVIDGFSKSYIYVPISFLCGKYDIISADERRVSNTRIEIINVCKEEKK
jgi:DNA polymerase-3 subunit alpha